MLLLLLKHIQEFSEYDIILGCTMMAMIPLPRLLYALSQDGLIPSFFSNVNKKTNIPVISTIISGILSGKIIGFDLN